MSHDDVEPNVRQQQTTVDETTTTADNTPELDTPGRVLRNVFGFPAFRPGQEDAIRAALAGRDVLAVLPTSGGKSLCYQVPALALDGLTVVVCPLVSLMKDQIDTFKAKTAKAGANTVGPEAVAALHSSLPAAERREVERRVRDGDVKILYVAPERLRTLEFVLLLKRARVSLVVVDEAHCISEWGHSFRPEYLFLSTAIEKLGAAGSSRPPVMAVTATADQKVRDDIAKLLRLREPELVRTGFDRPNLRYRVRWVADEAAPGSGPGPGRLPTILEALSEGEMPAIVYADTRRRCETIAAGLTAAAGVAAEPYHAGMPQAERDAVQGRFMSDETSVVVATVAFGMGVDKPNVRTVIHAGVPASIPAYVQEAGRGGRDGEISRSTVLFSPEELEHRKGLTGTKLTSPDEARLFFDALRGISTETPNGLLRANPKPRELGSLGGVRPEAASDALRALEATGRVSRRFNLWSSVRVRAIQPALARTGGAADPSKPAAKALPVALASRVGTEVGIPELARECGLSPASTQVCLTRLMTSGALDATPKGQVADVLLKPGPLTPRELAELKRRFELRAAVETRQLEDVGRYASLTTCRRARLLSHFGDETAEFIAPCHGCDICNEDQVSQTPPQPTILERLLGSLSAALGKNTRRAEPAPSRA